MHIPDQLNRAIRYIEDNLCAELDLDHAAGLACSSLDSFQRFFSYITGMTLSEYIRCRRLTRAAEDLRLTDKRIIDIAVQYGWDSTAAFSRAFLRLHGLSPSAYRKYGGNLKVYPPASFHIQIKGAKQMDMQLIELKETRLYGLSRPFAGQGYVHREELRNTMWSERYEDVPGKITLGRWDDSAATQMDGVWYGVWQGDKSYMIAREKDDCRTENLETFTLPEVTYAAFRTGKGGLAWEEFPRLFDQIFSSWLPSSGYRQKGDLAIEVLHLWADRAMRRKNKWYEVWIPVEPK